MLIKVTQEDIDAGEQNSCSKCPIALAAQRAFYSEDIRVGISFIGDVRGQGYRTPVIVKAFIKNFDADRFSVTPFEFELTDLI